MVKVLGKFGSCGMEEEISWRDIVVCSGCGWVLVEGFFSDEGDV